MSNSQAWRDEFKVRKIEIQECKKRTEKERHDDLEELADWVAREDREKNRCGYHLTGASYCSHSEPVWTKYHMILL